MLGVEGVLRLGSGGGGVGVKCGDLEPLCFGDNPKRKLFPSIRMLSRLVVLAMEPVLFFKEIPLSLIK